MGEGACVSSSRLVARALPGAALLALLGVPGSAFSAPPSATPARSALPLVSDAPGENLMLGQTAALAPGDAQHEPSNAHLPPVRENVELVSKLELSQPFGDVEHEQVA